MTEPATQPAIFTRASADEFIATPAAGGPWAEEHCHGGAPAGLLAALIEAHPANGPMTLASFTFSLVRPVPLGTVLRATTRERHQGRKAQLIDGVLEREGVLLGTARAVKLRQAPGAALPPPGEGPSEAAARTMAGAFSRQFTTVPIADALTELGPGEAWFRLNAPLLDASPPSVVGPVVAAADFGSGISHSIPFASWLFPSLDLSVYFARTPAGQWTKLKSRWLEISEGRTTCVTTLSDLHGEFGHAVQTILVEPRTGDEGAVGGSPRQT